MGVLPFRHVAEKYGIAAHQPRIGEVLVGSAALGEGYNPALKVRAIEPATFVRYRPEPSMGRLPPWKAGNRYGWGTGHRTIVIRDLMSRVAEMLAGQLRKGAT